MNWYIGVKLVLLTLGTLSYGSQGDSKAEDAANIKSSLEAYSEAINHQDVDNLASLLVQDATYSNLTTEESIEGKNEVAQYLIKQFKDEGVASFKMTVGNINIVEPGKATETGTAVITYKDKPAVPSAFKAELVKENGKWLLQKLRISQIQQAPSHYEELKGLDWLVGNWVDESEDVTVTVSYQWDKNKNFMTQHFTSKILDQDEIEGQQIIGWDPVKKKIRSWIFDTDGGFGESIWSKEGNSWYSQTAFTLPDGRIGSAVHIFTKIDDNTYTFASENRDIGGKMLPDIEPFKVVRKQGEAK